MSGRCALVAALAAVVAALTAGAAAFAHDARPLSVNIVEQSAGLYRVVVRAPPTLTAADAPSLLWPEPCALRQSRPLARDIGSVGLVECSAGLEGLSIGIDYPAFNPSITTLFRLESAEGAVATAVLPPDVATWSVPVEPSWRTVALDYIALGFSHIWEGPDHLMFVAGLLLLARRPSRILLAVTGFTAAHSITLSLATLGLVRLPIPPVEAMIALSILFLAAELGRNDPESFSRRFPVALSFTFGLLHGFGFASALGEVGLPRGELAVGLVGFNLGVELGQLAFIAAAGAAILLATRAARLIGPGAADALARRGVLAGAYALGVPAALWFFERSAAALAGP